MTFKLTLMILSIGKPVSSGLWISLIISSLFLFSTRSDLFTSAESIDIHFDNKDSGFFLKQTPYPSSSATDNDSKHRSSGSQGTSNGGFFTTNIADVSKGQNGGAGGVFASKKTVYKNGAAGSGIFDDKIIGVDRFTVFDNSGESTIAIKVNYGPFSTKQTIPSPFIVPEVPFGYFNGGNGTEDGAGASPAAPGGAGAVRASLMSRLAGSNSLDLSVHLVQSQIPRDNPVLRVLFHIGSSNTRRYAKQKLCIILQVSLGSKLLTTSCSPDNEDGVCLAQITIPSFWWTPLPNLPWKKHVKYPTRSVKVSYSVLETKLTPETHRPQVPLRGNTVSEPTSHVRTDRNAERSKLDRQTRGSNVEFPRRRGRREKTPGDADERGSKVEGSDVFGGGFDEDRMLDDDEYVNDETGTDTGNIDGLKRSQRNERDEDKEDEEDEDNYDDEENDDGSESDNKREDTQSTSTAFETRTQRTHRNTDDMQTPSSITNGNEGDMKIVKRTEGIMKTVGKTGNKIEDSTTSRSESSTKQSNSQSSSTRSSNIPRNDDAQIERITDRIIRTNRKQAPSDIGDNESKVDNKEMTGAGEHPQRQQKDQKEYAASAVVASRDTNNIGGESSFQNPPPGDSGNSLQSPPLGAQFEESQCLGHLSERVQIRPITMLGSVPLVHARVSYKEYYLDRNLIVLISHQPLYPLSRIHIPVFIYKQNVNAFVLRCRVKSALRIISVENANTRHWNLSVDISAKSSSATVTARKIGTAGEAIFDGDEGRDPSLGEVLSFLIEVVEESSTELWDEGKLVWTVKYPSDNSKIPNSSGMISQRALVSQYANVFNAYGDGSATVNRKARDSNTGGNTRINGGIARAGDPLGNNNNNNNHGVVGGGGEESKTRKVTAKFQIHKDDIYAVLPISKSWQILNTAVLSGRQISQPMKVFIVSQAGKIADVTLQSSCTSEDESVLKVSSSCSSVYVDGTEMRGSSNASILVRYDSYSGLAQFTIWMPEFPLDIQVGDTRLSQIKGWKISASDEIHYSNKFSKRSVVSTGNTGAGSGSNGGRESEMEAGPERVPSAGDNIAPVVNLDDMITEDNDLNSGSGSGQQSSQCRYKYQQTQVQVYARFVAPDHDTGRTRYLVSRRTSLRITDLVSGSMRPADPRIAYLHDNIVFGRSAGRTELQVLSPITGRVIGAREMRVTNDKVTPTSLSVNIVSGLQLNIEPDSSGVENGYVATTSVTRRLTAQYQEGLLDIELAFSDNTRTSIRDIPASDYLLVVDSLNPQVVAFAPMRVGSKHPRVIAVAEGRGELLRVAFLQPDACRPGGALKKSTPLLMSSVKVDIDFDTMGGTSDGLGGPSGTGSGSQKSDFVQNDGSAGNRGAAGNAAVKDFLAPDLRDILIGVPLKDTDSNDQPSVTAQRHSLHHTLSINNLLGPHHPHHNANLAPLEIGMYVLLTSFCIAIIIFVLSCVMYASKFKPPPDQNMDPSLPSSNGGGGFFSAFTTTTSRSAPFNKPSNANNPAGGYHHAYNKVSTSEDNSHDWVWLGRTPLERTAGANQSPMSINKGNNINRMRLMYNPACEENTEEILNNNNSENESSDASSSHRGVIDTNTYVKRDRGSNGIPPIVPPHSGPLPLDEDDEHKPPVPSRGESKLLGNSHTPNNPSLVGNFNNNPTMSGGNYHGEGRSHHHHHHNKSSRHSVHHKGDQPKERRRSRSRSRSSRKSDSGGASSSGGSTGPHGGVYLSRPGPSSGGKDHENFPTTMQQYHETNPQGQQYLEGNNFSLEKNRKYSTQHEIQIPTSSYSSRSPAREGEHYSLEMNRILSQHENNKYSHENPPSSYLSRSPREFSHLEEGISYLSPKGGESFVSRGETFPLTVRDVSASPQEMDERGTPNGGEDYGGEDYPLSMGLAGRAQPIGGRNQVVDIGLVEAVPKFNPASTDLLQTHSVPFDAGSSNGFRQYANIIGNPLFMNHTNLDEFNLDEDEVDPRDEEEEDEEEDFSEDTDDDEEEEEEYTTQTHGGKTRNLVETNTSGNPGERMNGKLTNAIVHHHREEDSWKNVEATVENSRSSASSENTRSSPDFTPEAKRHLSEIESTRAQQASHSPLRRISPEYMIRHNQYQHEHARSNRSPSRSHTSSGGSDSENVRCSPRTVDDVPRLECTRGASTSSPIGHENRLASYRISPEDDLKLTDMLKRKPAAHRKGHGKKNSISKGVGIDYDRLFEQDPAALCGSPIENPSIEEFDDFESEGRKVVDENLNPAQKPENLSAGELTEIHENLGTNNYFEIMKYFNNLKESNA